MRILRGKSNLEVSSQGFALFVVGLVLATFLGGAVRTILSSDRVHQRIVTELKNRFPRNEFQIGRTEVLLSHGIWPGLGLRLHDVVFKQDVCGKLSFVLTVPQAVLPIDLLSLRHGHLRLGQVEMRESHIHLDYRSCPAKGEPVVAGGENSPALKSVGSGQKGIRPPRLNWTDVSRALSALRLENFVVTYEQSPTWKLVFKNADFAFSEKMSLYANLDIQKSLPFGTLNHPVVLEAEGGDQGLAWNLNAEFKEGRLAVKGDWDLTSNHAQASAQLTQLPLKELSSELYQMGFVENQVQLRSAWLTCSADWAGQMEQMSASAVSLHACKLEGAYGRADLEKAQFFAQDALPFHEPAQLKVQKLQLQPLLEALGRQVLPAVIARLGVWSGAVTFAGPLRWQVDGFLENAEVVFSNQSVRGKQVIQRAQTLAQRTDSSLELKVKDIVLQDGEFVGQLAAHLNDDGRSGKFDLAVEKLSFSPAIQAILVGGEISPARLTGEGRLDRGELVAFNGQVQVEQLKGEGWRGNGLRAVSQFKPGHFHLEARAQRAQVDSQWREFAVFQQMGKSASDTLVWKDLNLRLEIGEKGGALDSFSALEAARNQPWRGKGRWARDAELTATVIVGGGPRAQTFNLRGEKGVLSLQGDSL